MKDIISFLKITFSVLAFCGLLFGIAYSIAYVERNQELKVWNNGHCNCGGKWVFNNGSHDRFTEYYWFKCVKCDNVAVFSRVNPAKK